MIRFRRALALATFLTLALPLAAQDAAPPPADAKSAKDAKKAKKPAAATAADPAADEAGFPGGVENRFLQTNTPLTNEKGLFEAALTHRFLTPANEAGGGGALGLDGGTSMGVVFDYVPVTNAAIQVRRVDINADFEFAAKVTALRSKKELPLAIGVRGGLDWQTASYVEKRTAWFAQLLASYTIADRVTLSANPACVQRTPTQDDTVCNVPLALQVRITRTIDALAEYVPAKKGLVRDAVGQWSFGIQKSVFHHKFALWIGNSGATNIDQMLAGDFNGGVTDSNIRIGFNLMRQFEIATD